MKYLSTEEYIFNLTELIKLQNRRIKKRFTFEDEVKVLPRVQLDEIMKKYDIIHKFVNNEIMSSVNNIKGNDRYIFQYFDDNIVNLSGNKEKYFKIIIKNKITNMENFIILTYDMREFYLKLKTPNSDSDTDVINYEFPLEKFSRSKFRQIFFEYLMEILELDTMPRFKQPYEFEELDLVDRSHKRKMEKINTEIEKVQKALEKRKSRQKRLEEARAAMAAKAEAEAEAKAKMKARVKAKIETEDEFMFDDWN
jgi:hypothetical protein